MRTHTRAQYDAYNTRLAQLNNVGSTAVTFAVEPSVQQTLEQRLQESSAFLSAINVIGVDEIKGEKVGIGASSTIAGRTDTSGNGERTPRDVTDATGEGYECFQTDFDTAIPYSRLDAWARHSNFQTLIRDAILERQALDRIMIGFNGKTAEKNTDRTANPLLQDVNIGWLQKYRLHASERVMDGGAVDGKIVLGAGGDYANMDALVMDAVSNLIEPWHQQDPDLVVVLGRNLVHDKYFPIINQDNKPTEQLAADLVLGAKRIGGLQPVVVPFMPEGKLMITSLTNLSLYWQIGGRRRYLQEQPHKNRVANFESSNDAYVVEDYGLGCVVENIELAG